MKYLLTVNDLSQLNDQINGVIIGDSRFSVEIPYVNIDLDKIDKDIYISINKIFHMEDLEDLEEYINSIKNKNIKGIFFSDLGVYTICRRLGISDKLIYDPTTLITNKEELTFWEGKIKGIVISPFISFDELKEFKSDKLELFFLGNGRIPLFYSKRPLITNYAKYHDISDGFIQHQLVIKEELREELFPIVEDENGTFVYTPYIFSCLDESSKLEGIIDYLIINLVYDNTFIKGDSKGFLDRKIVYRKE